MNNFENAINNGRVEFSQQSPDIEILFTGDFCPRQNTEKLILEQRADEILAPVRHILQQTPLRVTNLETPICDDGTPIPKSGPNIKVSTLCLELLKDNFNIACCANNHIGDFGPQAVNSTLELLAKNNITAFGAGKDLAHAERPAIIEYQNHKIAFLAFAENEFGIADTNTPGANPLNPLRNIRKIRDCASRADLTIVMIHGGNEFNPIPSPRMIDICRSFADAGASAVIAGHTHCPQGIEIWNHTPIVYSLGNFLFDAFSNYSGYNWWYGYMVKLSFKSSRIAAIDITPHHCSPNASQVTPLTGTERQDFLDYLAHISAIIQSPLQVRRYYEAWCIRSIKGYFARLSIPLKPLDWNNHESITQFMSMRNLHTCEAHNELITTTLKLLGDRREYECADYLPRLDSLCRGLIPSSPLPESDRHISGV